MEPKEPDYESRLTEITEIVKALARRVEELEATAFQLVGEEEVVLIAVPKKNTYAPK